MSAVFMPSTRLTAVVGMTAVYLFLSACSTQPARPTSTPNEQWSNRLTALQRLDSWDIKGRIAVKLEKDGGSASLQWQQRQSSYFIRIVGPFGKGTIELKGGPTGVSMENAQGQTVRALDPETLMLEALGWQVPLGGLQHWVKGIPDPEQSLDQLELDDDGRATSISQAGWLVNLERYRQQETLQLPTRLELINRKLKVKLLVRQWELPL